MTQMPSRVWTKTKGHWPKGKRRVATEHDQWLPLLRTLRRKLRDPEKGRSRRALAGALGVDTKTVRRWLAGEDWPHPRRLKPIQRWIESLRRSSPRAT